MVHLRQARNAVPGQHEELHVGYRVGKIRLDLDHMVVMKQQHAKPTQTRKVLELLDLIV